MVEVGENFRANAEYNSAFAMESPPTCDDILETVIIGRNHFRPKCYI